MVYISGADAIGCAIVAQRPLLMLAEDYNELNDEIVRLAKALAALRAFSSANAQDWPFVATNPTYSAAAVSQLDTWAAGVLRSGRTLRREIDSAGFALRERVIGIVAAVDREIVKTDPDPRGITELISGLGTSTNALIPGLLTKPAPKVESNKLTGAGNKQKGDQLIGLVEEVRAAASALSLRLDEAVTLADVTEKADACHPAEAQSNLRILPQEVGVVEVNADSTRTYTILGGAGIPRTGLAGDFPPDTVKVDTPLTNGVVQVVVKFDKKATGNAQLVVTDGSDLPPKIVSFRITPVEAKPNETSPATPSAAAPTPLGPVVAPPPAAADDPALAAKRVQAMMQLGPANPVEKEAHESGAIAVIRCELRLPLVNVSADGKAEFNDKFREAVFNFQHGKNIAPTGFLDDATVNALADVGGC
jgi:hypothetical protein